MKSPRMRLVSVWSSPNTLMTSLTPLIIGPASVPATRETSKNILVISSNSVPARPNSVLTSATALATA